MIRRHLIVQGRVQGVGFRVTAKQIAIEHELTGWVKNKNDGSVEIEAEGEQYRVERFIKELEKGPTPFAKVETIHTTDQPPEGSTSFRVIS
ncbi:acylphosphatase [Halobacillus fulvus]|nr:acylphosphatase [Halobacillus fulvus]